MTVIRLLLFILLLFVPVRVHGMSQEDAVKKVFEIVRLYESELTEDHIKEFKATLPHIANISEQRRCIRDFDYTDSFLSAAAIRTITCCRILVAHKADVNVADQWGNTPFDMARRFSCSDIMLFLLEMGTDTFRHEPKDMDFWTDEEQENFDQVLEVHHQKVAREVQLVLTRDTAGIVSEYVLGKRAIIQSQCSQSPTVLTQFQQ